MASLPSVPRPVYNELYDTNMTAWLLSTKDNLTQGQILVRVIQGFRYFSLEVVLKDVLLDNPCIYTLEDLDIFIFISMLDKR